MYVRVVHFKACKAYHTYFFAITDYSHLLSFCVSYNFVAQKWRISAIFHTRKKKINWKVLGFKAMFKSQNYKLGTSYLIKLGLHLRVVTVKKASCAGLQLRMAFGLPSCECGKSK